MAASGLILAASLLGVIWPVSYPDRRGVLRSGLALAALRAAGAVAGCTGSPKPAAAQARHELIGPDSPQVTAAEAARHATGDTVLAGVAPVAGPVDLGGLVEDVVSDESA
jgi:hypothetical protein